MPTPVFFQLAKAIPPFEIGDGDGAPSSIEFDLSSDFEERKPEAERTD